MNHGSYRVLKFDMSDDLKISNVSVIDNRRILFQMKSLSYWTSNETEKKYQRG